MGHTVRTKKGDPEEPPSPRSVLQRQFDRSLSIQIVTKGVRLHMGRLRHGYTAQSFQRTGLDIWVMQHPARTSTKKLRDKNRGATKISTGPLGWDTESGNR